MVGPFRISAAHGANWATMGRMKFDAYIFDLDGTLLDTLPDLVNLTNMVLREHGMPEHTSEEVNSYVGNGARSLLQRAALPGTPDDELDEILARWKALYPEHGHAFTHPYDGMPETLDSLKRRGAKLGVLSNKFDAATRSVIAEHFPGVFDIVRGESPDTPRKPDPTGLLRMIADLGTVPERVAYVGDSGGDMTVAINAGATPVGVSWGYRSIDILREAGMRHLLGSPRDLLDI